MGTYGQDPSLNQAPPPRAAGDPGERVRKFSPAFFAVMGLCFLLPFVSVTRSGQRVTTIKGIQLVTGGEAEIDPAFEETLEGFETDLNESFGATPEVPTEDSVTEDVPLGGGEDNEIERNIFAIVALAAAALGLILTLVLRGRTRDILAIVMSAVVIIGLIMLRFDLEGDVEEAQGVVAFQYRFGYWAIVALALIVIALHALGLRRRTPPPGMGPAYASGPPPPPPG